MPRTHTLSQDAADRRAGMTLAELDQFVTGAKQAGATGTEKVDVLVNFTRGAKSVAVKIDPTSRAVPTTPTRTVVARAERLDRA